MIFFTSDEHYCHSRILEYQPNRTFTSLEEMHEVFIQNNNAIVKGNDTVYHVGDFTFAHNTDKIYTEIISKLNGKHIFIFGSHDYWHKYLCKQENQRIMFHEVQHIKYNKEYIVACHYPMYTWPRSHYGSWHVYGHHHGRLQSVGKSYDVGVDNNNFCPVSFDELAAIMSTKPNNVNYFPEEKRRHK